jgi:hypothetical protein
VSRLSVFLDQAFPAIGSVAAQMARGIPAIAARSERGHYRANSWQTIGTAIDYRLRLAFAADAVTHSPAVTSAVTYARATARCKGGTDADTYRNIAELGREMLLRLESVTRANNPADREKPLVASGAAEEHLCRLCYVAAWYDALYRAGDLNDDRTKVLGFIASNSSSLDEMLDSLPRSAVSNMIELVRCAAGGEIAGLRASAKGIVTAPCFTGSPDVNGADADLVADDLLLEIKTYRNPSDYLREHLRQLLGYTLLDYNDAYRLQRVGLHYTRHAHLICWDVAQLIRALGSQSSLAELRTRCADALSPKRQGAGGA